MERKKKQYVIFIKKERELRALTLFTSKKIKCILNMKSFDQSNELSKGEII